MTEKIIIGPDGKAHKVNIENDEILKSLGIPTETAQQQRERLYREKQALIKKIDAATEQARIASLESKLSSMRQDIETIRAREARERAEQRAMPEPEFSSPELFDTLEAHRRDVEAAKRRRQ